MAFGHTMYDLNIQFDLKLLYPFVYYQNDYLFFLPTIECRFNLHSKPVNRVGEARLIGLTPCSPSRIQITSIRDWSGTMWHKNSLILCKSYSFMEYSMNTIFYGFHLTWSRGVILVIVNNWLWYNISNNSLFVRILKWLCDNGWRVVHLPFVET